MNSVSSSLSVYHGPPVISTEGCKWKSMYIFRVGCCVDNNKKVYKPIGIRLYLHQLTLTALIDLMSCFCMSDLRQRSITV